MPERILKPIRVAFIGTYPPRRCGIGTFTHDLAAGVSQLQGEALGQGETVQVVALTNIPGGYAYGREVCFEIRAQHAMDYRQAADYLNLSRVEVVSLQHEFGIFGGEDGAYILNLLGDLKKPVVTTLHTVLAEPTEGQFQTLKSTCQHSMLVVVQAQKAVEMLTDIYDVPHQKILMIHHGAPDVPFLDSAIYKDQFQAEGRRVILTFGLLSPKKGIEVGIEALASVAQEFPDVLYIVLGATHPEVKRRYGEAYRLSLERLVKRKGLEQHVVFHNRFVTYEQLVGFLIAADVFVTPYLTKEQIVSGTLAYAMACGKVIVSTPYWYAEELLTDGRGRLVPFRDAGALAGCLRDLLSDEMKRDRLRTCAYQFGRQMVWREVARLYIEALDRARQEYGTWAARLRIRERAIRPPAVPEVNLSYLRALTDDTGVLQHSVFKIPDRYHGYSADDNARAVVVAIMNWRLFKDESILPLLHTYLSFLNYALDRESGRVRNFMSYDRCWLEEIGSEDSHGRSLWALGVTVAHPPTDSTLALAVRMFEGAVRPCPSFTSPRAWAYIVLGCLAYLQRFGGHHEAQHVGTLLARRLSELFKVNGSEDWPWCEDSVTYDNARLPQALIAAGQWLGDGEMRVQGLRSLEWLLQVQTHPREGHLSLIGNKGWFQRGGERAPFDQQALDVAALIDACYEAYLATEDEKWIRGMDLCFDWFLGANDLHEVVCDFSTGGCKDGLHSAGVNQNQGAESTLAWLMALHRFHQVSQESALRLNDAKAGLDEIGEGA
jgi:glycosyltransferase involved in cell wall biosynthesis